MRCWQRSVTQRLIPLQGADSTSVVRFHLLVVAAMCDGVRIAINAARWQSLERGSSIVGHLLMCRALRSPLLADAMHKVGREIVPAHKDSRPPR